MSSTNPAQPMASLNGRDAHYRELCEQLPVGVFVIDVRDYWTYANPAARKMLGLSPSESLSEGWARHLHPEDSARVIDEWQSVHAAPAPWITEYRCHVPDRPPTWVRSHAMPQYDEDGSLIGFVGNLHDITEERRAAQALREQERFFHTIFDQAGVGVCVVDSRTGQFIQINQRYCDLVGYTADELKQRTFSSLTHPADLPHNLDQWHEMMTGRLRSLSMEKRYIRKDGRIVWVHLTITPLWCPGEPPDRHVTIVEDITQRKADEAELRRQEELLAHVSRLSTMGEMVAGIAHEVNQPLYSIVNFAKATSNVLAGSDAPDLDELRTWNDEIAAAAARAGEIVRRLRDYTRRSPEALHPENLNTIVGESLELVKYELRRAQVEVELELADAPPVVNVDRVQMQQVLVNLVKNAIDVLVGRPAGERRVRIDTRAVDGAVRVDVADSGPGLANLAADPFEPFVTSKREGMGLGLAISRTIVEAHGGRISASKNEWGGATFTFHIPTA